LIPVREVMEAKKGADYEKELVETCHLASKEKRAKGLKEARQMAAKMAMGMKPGETITID